MTRFLTVLTALMYIPLAASADVTPTTYDPATATGGLRLSDGDLRTTVIGSGIASSGGVRSVHSVTSGKYYWEVRLLCPIESNVTDSLGFSAGVIGPNVAQLTWGEYFHTQFASSVWGFLTDGPDAHHAGGFRRLFNNAGNMVDQDVIRLALDMDKGFFWLGRNDQWADGNPATGVNPTFSGLPSELYAAMMAGSRQCSAPPDYLSAVTNFGPTFDYPVPEGFNAGFGPIDTEVIDIDIKPGGDPNSVNLSLGQNIPVAVLTTEDFDATQVDPSTVAFGPDGAKEVHKASHVEDVGEDGDMDVLFHFNVVDTGIACGDSEAGLTGATFEGEAIAGADSIKTVKCPALDITTVTGLIGDKDCFGIGGVCSDGDHLSDLGVSLGDNRDPGDPLGTDWWGTTDAMGSEPSFDLELNLNGALPLSATLTTFTAGIDLVGATFYFNGDNIGFYVEPDGQENRAATVMFDVPIYLLSETNNISLAIPDLGLVQDGFVIDYLELTVETSVVSP